MKKILIITIIVLVALLARSASAQVVTSGSNDLSLIINPANISPNSTTTIKVSSYAFNVSQALFSWTLNGKKVAGGQGRSDFSFKTGGLGSQTTVSVTATLDGLVYDKQITLYQNSLDLMWEVIDGYAPSFYEGKIFPAIGSTVRVVAMPNIFSGGKQINSSKLDYQWSKNFKLDKTSSGLGKSSFEFTVDALNKNNVVEVVVTPPNQPNLSVKQSVAIPTPSLQIVIYENRPLVGGLYGHALQGEWRQNNSDSGLVAEVFNISQNTKAGLTFQWLLNNKLIPVDTDHPNSLFFNNISATSSRGFLTVIADNPANIFQTARQLLTVYLGNGVQF